MAEISADEQRLFSALRALKAAWPMGGFSWDSRLSSVASSFGAMQTQAARAAVALGLPTAWTHETIQTAPERIADIANRYDGVRRGQLLFTGGDVEGLLAFGLWWPWGTSETISLRVGLDGVDESRSQHGRFRDIFGVQL
jgi:hypothetical protein